MNIHSNLTLRYSLALGLVATILISTHFIAAERIEATRHDSRLIDISGMQRMLSQRIALLATEMTLIKGMNATYKKGLSAAVRQMTANHHQLKADWSERAATGQAVYAAYLAPDGMDVRVQRYIDSARSFLNIRTGSGTIEKRQKMAAELGGVALNGSFLPDLDAVVKRYTRESEERADHLHQIQSTALIAGLVVLLLEVLLIFRPMVRRIASCIRVLDEANEELRTLAASMSQDLRAPIVDSVGLIRMIDNALSSGQVAEARAATRNVYASIITLDGVLDELLEVVGRHRKAITNFSTFERRGQE